MLTFVDPALVKQVEEAVGAEVVIVRELAELASKHPYYKSVPPRPSS